ncbi:hypothetical protein J3Q64DRAFT_1693790 [Phycomyces blakesleeanus]|uniref:Uncharacterized protein n=2 Tax=Phycomyces blakesleeanus TaxID=4837 RepID=A0A167Q5P3_PHYB8|nr:hypothetical protein PHYBLDRAFT_162190 [Phycomyces blakesleeanus NRRL 1555(-)]OAD79109.1 hypothetical protein PHYBLDRAFT_162190 [Phycomyces blakesleeanus NRRL 1555(-)]|eukprot:XP_018297149.1 hypothetical protein PHYBLDRAFT_162190 [Phycomyces blakesleeanus NRRL 1555(-)]
MFTGMLLTSKNLYKEMLVKGTNNGKLDKNSGFGQRIDLIFTTKNIKLSTSEWKPILTYLLDLPFNEACGDCVFTAGIDLTGPMRYILAIKQLKDIYVAKPVSTLFISTYLDKLELFEKTVDCLYAWQNHCLRMKKFILPALRKCRKEVHFSSFFGTYAPEDSNSSPNTCWTPS